MSARSSPARTQATTLFYFLVRGLSPRSKLRATARWLALIAVTQQISCSGGAGTSINSSVVPRPVVTVSVSPPSAQISPGASVQFLVSVRNASNPAVNWQVNGVSGGNSSVGAIAPSGAATASYTAPANVSGALTVTVAAVLQADATKFGSATVTINPLPGAQISVSPINANVVEGTSLQFNATVQNGPPTVIWEVNNVPGGTANFGTISSSGYYTAPTTIPARPMVTITALLFSDSSVSGSTNVTIVLPIPAVSISPGTANVPIGQTLQLTATVQNSNAPVNWGINGPGTIVPAGYTASFTAPASVSSPLTVTITAVLQTTPQLSASASITVVPLDTFTGVYSWRNDNSLTGQNSQEATLTPSNVNSTQFVKLFRCAVDGAIFAQPLYVANVAIQPPAASPGTHNVVYVATENDSVYAFDADANPCQTLWQVSFMDPTAGITAVPATDGGLSGETDITPIIGITGTPVIDPASATLYVVTKTKENGNYVQRLHALDLTTGWVSGSPGTEKFGGPAAIQAVVNGTGDGSVSGELSFDPLTENQRSALLLAGGNVYVAFDSYDDTPPVHGWLFAYDAGNLKSAPAVFVSTPNGSNGGIGESGAAPSSDVAASSTVGGNIFVVTSDGTFDANSGGSDYAETLLKLQVNTGFTIANPSADTFTPSNEATLNLTQRNFGSTGVMLPPSSAGGSAPLAIVGSEAAGGTAPSPDLYLVNRGNLGGFTSAGVVQTLCLTASGDSGLPASIFGTPAYWASNNTVYVAAANDSLKAFPLASGTFASPTCPAAAVPSSQSTDIFDFFGGSFGASPVISWDGTNASSGIVWALDTSGYLANPPQPAILYAYKATDLTRLYVSPSSGSGAAGLAVRFAVPTVAKGKAYVGTAGPSGGTEPQGELSVFGLLP